MSELILYAYIPSVEEYDEVWPRQNAKLQQQVDEMGRKIAEQEKIIEQIYKTLGVKVPTKSTDGRNGK